MSNEGTDRSEMASPPPFGRRARRQAEIRARLIEAGRGVFTQHGLDEATIAEITAAADVGFGTFYLYFPTKEALYRAVVGSGFRALGEQLDRVSPISHEPWRVTLRLGVETLFRFAAENRDLFLLMFAGREPGGGQGGGGGNGGRGPIAAWVAAIVRAAAEAERPAGDPAAEEILELLDVSTIAALRRSINWWIRNFEAADDSSIAAVGAAVVRFIAGGITGALRPEAVSGEPEAC